MDRKVSVTGTVMSVRGTGWALIGPMLMLGALLGESVGAEGPMLDGVAVGAAEEVYVGLYMMAVLDGNAVGAKYVTDLN